MFCGLDDRDAERQEAAAREAHATVAQEEADEAAMVRTAHQQMEGQRRRVLQRMELIKARTATHNLKVSLLEFRGHKTGGEEEKERNTLVLIKVCA